MATGVTNTLELTSGVNAIGIYTKDTLPINNISDSYITIVKTIKDSNWKSWTKDTPDQYQGFTDLESSKGYVAISDSDMSIDLPSSLVDVNTITPEIGLNAIALPFTNKQLKTSYIGKMKVFNVRTYDNGWKSWTADTPDQYQGFIDVDYKKGYIVNVDDVNAANLDAGIDNIFNLTEWGSDITDPNIYTIPGLYGIYNAIFINDNGYDVNYTYKAPYTIYNLNNITFNTDVINSVYDEDISLNYITSPIMDETAVIDNIFNIKTWGSDITVINPAIYHGVHINNGIIFLDNYDRGVIDTQQLQPVYNISPVMDETAVIDNIFNLTKWGSDITVHIPTVYKGVCIDNGIIFLDNYGRGVKDDQSLYPSYALSPIMDETAVIDNIFNIKTWGSDITVYPARIEELHVTPEFIGPNTISVVDQDLTYDVSNFIDTFKN